MNENIQQEMSNSDKSTKPIFANLMSRILTNTSLTLSIWLPLPDPFIFTILFCD